jgi:hypothetical protein
VGRESSGRNEAPRHCRAIYTSPIDSPTWALLLPVQLSATLLLFVRRRHRRRSEKSIALELGAYMFQLWLAQPAARTTAGLAVWLGGEERWAKRGAKRGGVKLERERE